MIAAFSYVLGLDLTVSIGMTLPGLTENIAMISAFNASRLRLGR